MKFANNQQLLKFLKENFIYTENTGKLWRKFDGKFTTTSSMSASGYLQTRIKNKTYYTHKLIWMLYYDEIPQNELDHIDGNKINNKIENLRKATHSENNRNRSKPSNNTSGYKGVAWHKQENKWRAYITINQKQISLGLYDDKEDAVKAYNNAATKYHGEFAKLNNLEEE